jgi:aspartyl aminopeptidase
MVRGSGGGETEKESVSSRLVQFRDPMARISNLAIHLQSPEERVAFKVNKEDHTVPIIAMDETKKAKSGDSGDAVSAATQLEKGAEDQLTAWHDGHEPLLLQRIADELGVEVGQIADVDLSLYDTQPAALGGMHKEFLYSARLDNLATVFCSVEGLLSHASTNLATDENVSVVVCFDHEEVGSVSSHGAGSPVLQTAIDRIGAALGVTDAETKAATLQNSFILSVDQAHAVHPNYSGKHEPQHAPMINHGIVIKTNSNQRYTTNSLTGFVVRELGRKAGVPMQEFCGTCYRRSFFFSRAQSLQLSSPPSLRGILVLLLPVRNDCPCGSTIGPTISALTGIRTVDIGMPQLSMHR